MKRTRVNVSKWAFGLGLIGFGHFTLAATVATVNGKIITDDDLSRFVANMPQVQKSVILKDKGAKKQLIENLIDQEVLSQEASSKKIEDSKEYKDAVAAFKKQELVNLLVQRQLNGRITDEQAKSYFDKNKYDYSNDQVHALHILLESEAEAKAVLDEARKPMADFQAIADKRSKDPSVKNNHGDVGFFTRSQFDPAFSKVAFAARIGDVVGPVKTLFGYHVIKVTERKNGKLPTYEEVEQKVRADMQREMLQDYVTSLRKKSKITE